MPAALLGGQPLRLALDPNFAGGGRCPGSPYSRPCPVTVATLRQTGSSFSGDISSSHARKHWCSSTRKPPPIPGRAVAS